MTDEQILARWNEVREQVERQVSIFMKDPTAAALAGVVPVFERTTERSEFGSRVLPPRNELAGWLRGAAAKLVPAGFRWTVTEAVGGRAYLMLLQYELVSPD